MTVLDPSLTTAPTVLDCALLSTREITQALRALPEGSRVTITLLRRGFPALSALFSRCHLISSS